MSVTFIRSLLVFARGTNILFIFGTILLYSVVLHYYYLPISFGSGLTFQVQSPSDIAGVYLDSYLNINPTEFELTAQLILPEPLNLCSSKPTNADKWNGKIVLIVDSNVYDIICIYHTQTRRVVLHLISHVSSFKKTPKPLVRYLFLINFFNLSKGQLIMCTDRSCAVLGYKAIDNQHNEKIILPSLNFKGQEILEFMQQSPDTVVTVHMKSTGNYIASSSVRSSIDQNPWEEYGNGPAGKSYTVILELFSFVCLISASWKLYAFIKFQRLDANITQISLAIEILVAICKFVLIYYVDDYLVRILYLPQPLSFGNIYLPVAVSEWFIETPNVLSLITTLLISFYW